ncbi:MAG: hypothetical protein CMF87_00920 [Candidatus Marinimicrobia bacterium]|jgi:hypothetical protein|nr:hypothetical protein [Candidatus Neomarinimicrobiota bacterium]|tara:strand:- start:760 stop:951 length:192 start_codon:yes stop_codon:yes gene_type:complete
MMIILTLIFIDVLAACAVCYGSPDEPAVKAVQAGIWFLLGVVIFVLSSIGLFMYNIGKKSREL